MGQLDLSSQTPAERAFTIGNSIAPQNPTKAAILYLTADLDGHPEAYAAFISISNKADARQLVSRATSENTDFAMAAVLLGGALDAISFSGSIQPKTRQLAFKSMRDVLRNIRKFELGQKGESVVLFSDGSKARVSIFNRTQASCLRHPNPHK